MGPGGGVGGIGGAVGVLDGTGVTLRVGVAGTTRLALTVEPGVGKRTGGGIVPLAAGTSATAGLSCLFCSLAVKGVGKAGVACLVGVGAACMGATVGVAVTRTTTLLVTVSPVVQPASSRVSPAAARKVNFRIGAASAPFQSRAASRRSRACLAMA